VDADDLLQDPPAARVEGGHASTLPRIPEKVAVAHKTAAPKTSKKKTPPTKIAQAAAPAPASKEAESSHKSYKVRTGDTLYRIAVRHGVTVAEILAVNSLGGVSIRPGDTLRIPAKK